MSMIHIHEWEHEIWKSLKTSQFLATKSQKACRLHGPLKLKTNHHFVRKHFNCIAQWIHKISVSILDISQHYKMFFFPPKNDRPAGHVLKSRLTGMLATAGTLPLMHIIHSLWMQNLITFFILHHMYFYKYLQTALNFLFSKVKHICFVFYLSLPISTYNNKQKTQLIYIKIKPLLSS